MTDLQIPFNKPFLTGLELDYISKSHKNGQLSGDGPFTESCHRLLQQATCSEKVLLTHSCTAALEMAALLLDLKNGDEVIMPSYTFVSTANAFVLRGAKPVFVDIRGDTLNINEALIESAITDRTKVIVPVHYAGVSAEMDSILSIAKRFDIAVIEDAAQGFMATYKDRPLGGIGDLGAFSFHETKNVISGEGGALVVGNDSYAERAEVIREKGTDRSRFSKGYVDKYTWQDIGSSYLPGEVTAAFLYAQLERASFITKQRLQIWSNYHKLLVDLESSGLLRRPIVPNDCEHNGHMYYVLLPIEVDRSLILSELKKSGIHSVFHYVPLHSSPGGKKYGRKSGSLDLTDNLSRRIIRLPLWVGLTFEQQKFIVETLHRALLNA